MTDKALDPVQAQSIQTALSAIEGLAFAGRGGEASAFMAELWPFISAGYDGLPGLEDTNIFAAIALGYVKLNNEANVRKYANNAIIQAPADRLALALTTHNDRINVVRQFLHHHQKAKAIGLLHATKAMQPDAAAEVEFYLHLLSHYEAEAARVRALKAIGGRPTLFNLVVWGDAFIDKFLATALPSLLAPGNIPALLADDPVILDIYTNEAGRDYLNAAPLIQSLQDKMQIDYTLFPEALTAFKSVPSTYAPDRLYVSAAQYLSLVKAKALGADLTHIVTEGIYSDAFYARAKQYVRNGFKAVLMSSVRARDSGLAAYLGETGAMRGDAIVLPVEDLLDYTANNLSPHLNDLFIRPDGPTVGQDPIALYFKTGTGFAAHTFQISPALIAHEAIPADFTFDYHTSDGRLLAELAAGQDPAVIYKVIHNPADDFFVVDLESGPGGETRSFGDFPVTVDQCVQSTTKWCGRLSDLPYFEWAFQQRFAFTCNPSNLPDGGLEEAQVVADYLAAFRAAQDNCRLTINYYRGDL